MAPLSTLLNLYACAGLLQYAGQASAVAIDRNAAIEPRGLSGYAPTSISCPSGPLVRDATSLGSSEAAYIKTRKANADVALAAWLQKTDPSFATTDLPTLGLVLSGGGYRAHLAGAGVVQGMDARDGNFSTSGLYQALSYQVALSGGAWFTSSLTGNNWPTVSYLSNNLWEDAFADSLLVPAKLLSALAYARIVKDIVDKQLAGYIPTLVDVWGRLLSFQLLEGPHGGVSKTLSGLTSFSNFTSHAVPYPILTARSINLSTGECLPQQNGTQYEMSPYEFGSWDNGVKAFTQTAYLGSRLINGAPAVSNKCISGYDNLGYILGTSSDIFNNFCSAVPARNNTNNLEEVMQALLLKAHVPVTRDLISPYPNPFYKYPTSSLVSAQPELDLADGGEGEQNLPIWPLIQPERNVSVMIVSDNSADTSVNFPNGSAIRTTYLVAKEAGLTKMPFIPDTDVFAAQGLAKRATFFGCDEPNTVTLVYLPNNDYTYASNIETVIIETSKAETEGIIANGNQVASQGGDKEWPVCLGCALMKKTGTTLPAACTACFDKYCFKQ